MTKTLNRDDVAARLQEARKAKFPTAKAAAESLGVPYGTYANNENGNDHAGIDRLAIYARRFRVSLEWLLTGEGRGPRKNGEPRSSIDRIYEMAERLEDMSPELQDRLVELAMWEMDRETARKP